MSLVFFFAHLRPSSLLYLFTAPFPLGFINLGVALELLGRTVQAKTLYRECIQQFPTNKTMIASLVNMLQVSDPLFWLLLLDSFCGLGLFIVK